MWTKSAPLSTFINSCEKQPRPLQPHPLQPRPLQPRPLHPRPLQYSRSVDTWALAMETQTETDIQESPKQILSLPRDKSASPDVEEIVPGSSLPFLALPLPPWFTGFLQEVPSHYPATCPASPRHTWLRWRTRGGSLPGSGVLGAILPPQISSTLEPHPFLPYRQPNGRQQKPARAIVWTTNSVCQFAVETMRGAPNPEASGRNTHLKKRDRETEQGELWLRPGHCASA